MRLWSLTHQTSLYQKPKVKAHNMPKYEYICDECGYTFTEIHSYKEVLTDCPECDASGTLTKLLNTPVNLSYKQVQKTSKPGTVINDAILSTREEIEVHKKELKNRKANHDG